MSKQFGFDLRLTRRKSGFTQCDVAHLIDSHQSNIVALEKGDHLPTLEQICALSQVFGRTFEGLFSELIEDARKRVRTNLASLPEKCRETALSANRKANLQRLERRLLANNQADHDG